MLNAGTFALNITPDRPLYLQGYGNRTHPSTGNLDPLEARVIVFDDGTTQATIISVDLIGLDATSVTRIRKAAALSSSVPEENVIVVCSHTHSGPAVQTLGDSPVDQAYIHWLEQTLGSAVGEASNSMVPVSLAVGEGSVEFNVNRRLRRSDGSVGGPNPFGAVDHRVRVLRFDPVSVPSNAGGLGNTNLPEVDPVAILFSFACHPTVLMGSNYRYSSDYPGSARRFIETAYGGKGFMAAFLPGCFGNIRPHLVTPDGAFRSGTDHELTVLGRILGTEVVQVAEGLTGEPVDDIAMGSRKISLPYSHVPSETELMAVPPDDNRRRWWADNLLDEIKRNGHLRDHDTGEVTVLRIGRHWISTTPGETLIEIGWSIESGLAELGIAKPADGDMTLALGYSNGNSGYLCTSSAIQEGGYEPAKAYFYYLHPGPFAPEVEQILTSTALDLAKGLTN